MGSSAFTPHFFINMQRNLLTTAVGGHGYVDARACAHLRPGGAILDLFCSSEVFQSQLGPEK